MLLRRIFFAKGISAGLQARWGSGMAQTGRLRFFNAGFIKNVLVLLCKEREQKITKRT